MDFRWSATDRQILCDLYRQGASLRAMAETTGRSYAAVKYKIRHLRESGFLSPIEVRDSLNTELHALERIVGVLEGMDREQQQRALTWLTSRYG